MKLNLGCGKDYIDDWVNVDFYDDSKCDEVHDLEEFPWPWDDDSVSEIGSFILWNILVLIGRFTLKSYRRCIGFVKMMQ